jgi:RimJ/RimL family protein N-acetyltransferase
MLSFARPYPRCSKHRGYYQRFPGYGFWAALEKTTGEFLGWFHFRPGPNDPQDQPELGYRLRHAAWGRGTRRRDRGP